MIDWIPLDSDNALESLIEKSFHSPQVILKHSPRCSISTMIKSRLERAVRENPNTDFYLNSVLEDRPISNKISDKFKIHHESPQILVIQGGDCIFDESHGAIMMEDIENCI